MKSTQFNLNTMLLTLLMALALTACGGGGSSDTANDEAATPTNPSAPSNSAGATGKALWASHCASCHGGDYGKGRNAAKTMSAIASNEGGMGILKGVITSAKAGQIAVFTANPGAY